MLFMWTFLSKMILMFTSQSRATGFCQVEQNYPSPSQNKNVVQTNAVCIMELSSRLHCQHHEMQSLELPCGFKSAAHLS